VLVSGRSGDLRLVRNQNRDTHSAGSGGDLVRAQIVTTRTQLINAAARHSEGPWRATAPMLS